MGDEHEHQERGQGQRQGYNTNDRLDLIEAGIAELVAQLETDADDRCEIRERLAAIGSKLDIAVQLLTQMLVLFAGRNTGGSSGGDESTREQFAAIMKQLQRIITQGEKMAGEFEALVASVEHIRGKADSLIALTKGLGDFIRANLGNTAALGEMAGKLTSKADEVQAAIDANPLPGEQPTPQ